MYRPCSTRVPRLVEHRKPLLLLMLWSRFCLVPRISRKKIAPDIRAARNAVKNCFFWSWSHRSYLFHSLLQSCNNIAQKMRQVKDLRIYPPPTKCTTSIRSPSLTGVSDHFGRVTTSPLSSTAIRCEGRASTVNRSSKRLSAGMSRGSPFRWMRSEDTD